MYKNDFIELVNFSFNKSEKFYSELANVNQPNPFYIGYGNPNSKVLILGKEKGFNVENLEQLRYESIENPSQWKHYIDNKISINKDKFYDSKYYTNVFYPYLDNQKSGHTWSKYKILLQNIFSEHKFNGDSFFDYSFISEINYKPSKLSVIKYFNDETRIQLLMKEYFKSFPIIILACGNYLKPEQIEQIFDLKFDNDFSENREKLVAFKSEQRVLVNTRQLSMDVKNEYLKRISELVKPYLKNDL